MLGRAVEIGGFAFAGNQGIAKVEVSVNGGLTWNVAKLEPPLSPDVFTFLYHIRFAKCILEKYGMAASI